MDLWGMGVECDEARHMLVTPWYVLRAPFYEEVCVVVLFLGGRGVGWRAWWQGKFMPQCFLPSAIIKVSYQIAYYFRVKAKAIHVYKFGEGSIYRKDAKILAKIYGSSIPYKKFITVAF